MTELFLSGQIAGWVIGFTLFEGVVLAAYNRSTGRGIPPRLLVGNLLAGICLLLALRAALQGAAWGWIEFFLLAAMLAHASDLWCRWRR